jgi:hypothetical protein
MAKALRLPVPKSLLGKRSNLGVQTSPIVALQKEKFRYKDKIGSRLEKFAFEWKQPMARSDV